MLRLAEAGARRGRCAMDQNAFDIRGADEHKLALDPHQSLQETV
jgi:hypothetical protein